MNNIEEYDERIEKFLLGEMTPMEEAEFKDDLAADKNLQERAKVISALIRGLKRRGEDSDSKIINENSHNKTRAINTKFIAWGCSVAAVILLLFSIFNNTSEHNKNEELFSSNYSVYSTSQDVRGEEDSTVVEELSYLFNSMESSKDCSEIIEKLEPIYNSLDSEYTYRLYSTDIAWYLSLAYIKNGKLDDAQKILIKIINDNEGTDIATKAQILLNGIKDVE